jgi:hypothetical protein
MLAVAVVARTGIRGEARGAEGAQADLLAELVERDAHACSSARARPELRDAMSISDFPVPVCGTKIAVDRQEAMSSEVELALILSAEGRTASISVSCADQAEVDRMWSALLEGGGAEIQCGSLRDPWSVPWQIVPEVLPRLLDHEDRAVARRVFEGMQSMVKVDVADIERAAKG